MSGHLATCRYCDDWHDQNMLRYGPRHHAHPHCFLTRRPLTDLPWHQIERIPYLLLKKLNLLDQARDLIAAKHYPKSARQKRLDKILRAVSHETNKWGRVKFKIVDATKEAKKPCFEIRYYDNNEMHSYATSFEEAARYAEGTLQGVVVTA